MGASNSKAEEDKGLQLCRARKKFIKQALIGRCSLAAAHIAYIEELKILGSALRKFVETNDFQAEAFIHPSRSTTPEPSALIKKSISQSPTRDIDHTTSNISPSPSSIEFKSHHMKFSSTFSKKIEEKPSVPLVVSSFETPPVQSDAPPWDYFGLFHPTDENHFPSQERPGFDLGSEGSDEMRHLREEEEEGIPELEDVEDNSSSCGTEQSQESEDEFDEPSTSSLVRSFRNVNITKQNVVNDDSPILLAKDNIVDGNEKKNRTPDLSDAKIESEFEVTVASKDFFSSMNEIEELFVKASESGQEVPRMLEANKFQFRPAFSGKERGPITSSLLKSCFSCGKDPSEVQEEPPQSSVKYLTCHRTASSHSASSRNLLDPNSTDDFDDANNENLFDNFCMVSGSHASTLDRLYAWEKKLYDEVKAGQVLRGKFDQKRKLLRQKESREDDTDKTRSAVKDLYSRIRVAIHRIDLISRKIEEIRDVELQPQLEELIEGLRKMWEMMLQCHRLQFHIISISHTPPNTKMKLQSNPQRQITVHLEYQLSSLLSTFTKWIVAQNIYIETLDKWLFKCVSLPQNRTKRNKRMKPPPIRNIGPPIYMICGSWLEMIDELPSREVGDSIRDLANEVARFLPRQGKKGKSGNVDLLGDEGFGDRVQVLDQFRTSLGGFLGELNKYSECSLKMFEELQKGIQEAKSYYDEFKSRNSQVLV